MTPTMICFYYFSCVFHRKKKAQCVSRYVTTVNKGKFSRHDIIVEFYLVSYLYHSYKIYEIHIKTNKKNCVVIHSESLFQWSVPRKTLFFCVLLSYKIKLYRPYIAHMFLIAIKEISQQYTENLLYLIKS